MTVTKDCMIANLQLGVWLGYRLDKSAAKRITEEAAADEDAIRVNKHLIPKDALKPVVAAAGSLRAHFYDATLPWKDNGDRLLTRKIYPKFIEAHHQRVGVFNDAVESFLTRDYLAARDRAEFRMGELFDPKDYPTSEELSQKFYVNLDIDAVTEAGDFRVDLEKNAIDEVRASMETAMQARLGRAMHEVWGRLAITLGHFAEKMNSDDVFRGATVGNLEELVDLLPDLNILGDPNLTQITEEIRDTLVGYDPKQLRTNKETRAVVGSEAQRIMDDVKGFMSAFGAT